MEVNTFTRINHHFFIKGITCSAWIYLPDGIAQPPVVVMGNGFGAERSILMPAFAERFVQRGIACFVFDYRNFGDSAGMPRKLVSPIRHLEDWEAVIREVRTVDLFNTRKIALWGTSFSGGHIIIRSAKDHDISAIVAQVPFVDGISSIRGYSLTNLIKGTFHGLMDLFSYIFTFGRIRHYVPIVSDPDTFGILNTPGTLEACREIMPADFFENRHRENECPAIIVFTLPFYRPVKFASMVKCPALIIHAEKDNLIPVDAVKRLVSKLKNAEYFGLPLSHFDIYQKMDSDSDNTAFEKVVKLETDFLVNHLS